VRRDLAFVAGGLALLVAAAVPVDPDRVPGFERAVFRAVNTGTHAGSGAVWVVMQLGMIGVVPLSAAVALLLHRHRLALALLLAGALAYGGGKVVKRIVERGRPDDLLDDVAIQGAAAHGLGFVSGHAAVAFALATVVSRPLGGPDDGRRFVAFGVAIAVCLARVHVGAHLPLDVVGGAGLGLAAGGLARLTLGRPACS
jgi:undecaprenyl-diphosphatase